MQDKPYMLYKDAKKFLSDKGIDFNENEITIATEYTGKKAIGVKKGYALHALESNEVLDEFIGLHWPGAKSKGGLSRQNKYRELKVKNESSLESDEEDFEETYETQSELAFELESQLRDFLAHNLSSISINNQGLKLYIDENGRNGIEYPTGVGPIDILATDSKGNFYAFELKRAKSPDKAIGQIARYMGWLKNEIGKNKEVNGIIVAKEITENLKYSVAALNNVSLFEYAVSFTLNTVEGYN